jgi:hypothetical protein
VWDRVTMGYSDLAGAPGAAVRRAAARETRREKERTRRERSIYAFVSW